MDGPCHKLKKLGRKVLDSFCLDHRPSLSQGRFCLAGVLLFVLITLPSIARAQHYDYSPLCQRAHQALLARELDKANDLLQTAEKKDPQNLLPQYLYHYRDFLKLYMYGRDKLYRQLDDRVQKRLDQLEKGPENSPYHGFTIAEVNLIWSLLQVRKGDYWSAGMDLYNAYKGYQSTAEQFPDFMPAQRMLVAIQGMVGTLPGAYQWIMKRFGVKGDLNSAIKTYPGIIDHLAEKPRFEAFHRESLIIFSYMQLHLMNAEQKAWGTIRQATSDHPKNPLSALLRANMALNMQKAQTAAQILERFGKQDAPIPYLNYLKGSALLYDLQPESRYYLEAYIRDFEGGTYIKDTYLKMGWAGLLNGDLDYYETCKSKLRSKGSTVRATDEQALEEAEHYNAKNRHLLKARLRYDGGYYKEALQILRKHPEPTINQEPKLSSLEYHYRLGRIYQAMDKPQQALDAYAELLHLDSDARKHYYLPGAVLQTGLIYEKTREPQKAKQAFERVLDFGNYPYSKALSQKAKAGLKRLSQDD